MSQSIWKKTLTAAFIAAVSLGASVSPAAADEVVFSSWGGAFQDALRSSMLDPASEAL